MSNETAAPEAAADPAGRAISDLLSCWTPVNEAMPEYGKKVLASYVNSCGKERIIVGSYVGKLQEEAGVDDDWFEYDEATDNYYLPEGWYEQQENWGEYSSIFVNEGAVTHWMPLPKPPAR